MSTAAHYLVLGAFAAALLYVVAMLVIDMRARRRRASEELSARRFANALAAFDAAEHESRRASPSFNHRPR